MFIQVLVLGQCARGGGNQGLRVNCLEGCGGWGVARGAVGLWGVGWVWWGLGLGWMDGSCFWASFSSDLTFILIVHTKLKIISYFYLNFIQNLRLYLTFILTLTKIKIKVGY